MIRTAPRASWYWDGVEWRPFTGVPGEWWWDGHCWRDRGAPPKPIRVARMTVRVQAYMTAYVAGLAVLLAAVGLVSGLAPLAAAAAGVGILLAGGAWSLGALGRALVASRMARWVVSAVEGLVLLPAGLAMIVAADRAAADAGTPANPGTDGPFADGGVGALGLLGYAYLCGAIVVLLAMGSAAGSHWLRARPVQRRPSASR